MSSSLRQPVRQLPLVPSEILKARDVFEKYDTRFRACARLLQAIWREAQGLAAGNKQSRKGRNRRLGSRLHATAASAGRNFLAPSIAELAQMEIAYQERGALIDRERLNANLLSSMPLAFNLAGPWRLDPDRAAFILRKLLPVVAIEKIIHVWFEHSPNRLDPEFTGDRSALDIAVIFERPDGKRGLIGIEVKYSEDMRDSCGRNLNEVYDELAQSSALYKEPSHAALRVNPLQQLFREHLLCFATLKQARYAEAHFVLIAPRHNHRIERVSSLYSAFLTNPTTGTVPYHYVELERVIAAFAASGDEHYAALLFERYCDWSQIDTLIEAAIADEERDWSVQPVTARPALSLIASAA